MKVGIVTQPLLLNYGGVLQNYALQVVLRSLGHTPCTIDWERPMTYYQTHESQRIMANLKTCFLKHIGRGHGRSFIQYRPSVKELSVITQSITSFVDDYIVRTPIVNSVDGFKKQFEYGGFDALISGSDQVWRPRYNAFLPEMFLRFAKENQVRRVAYAASFGTDRWEYSNIQTEECARLVRLYDRISVREDSGISLCRDHFGVEATLALDPTMLLSKENYVNLVRAAQERKSDGNLFHYILDPSERKMTFVQGVADKYGLKPFTAMPKRRKNEWTKPLIRHQLTDCIYPSVTQWLRGFMDAELVVVDSFHGAVFSIIFNKPFWIIGNTDRGLARFISLLHLFNLEKRLLSVDNLSPKLDSSPIEWPAINALLAEYQQVSIRFLEAALK